MKGIVLIASSFLLSSLLLGVLLIQFLKIDRKYSLLALPVGIISLFGVIQIFFYPIQILELKVDYLVYIYICIELLILFFTLINYKKILEFVKSRKGYLIWFMFFIFLSIITIYFISYLEIYIRTNDGQYYINLINQKNMQEFLVSDRLAYKYQGFYDLSVVFVKIYNYFVSQNFVDPILTIGVVTNVNGIIFATFMCSTIVNFAFYIKEKGIKSWVAISFGLTMFVYYLTSNWFSEWFYIGNSFRKISVALIVLFLIYATKQKSNRLYCLVSLFIISLISQTSTGFFFSAIIIYALLFYYAYINDKNYLRKIAILGIGPAIFMILFMRATVYIVIPLYIVYFILLYAKKLEVVEKLFNKIYLFILIFVPLIFGIISRLPGFVNPSFLIEGEYHPILFKYGVENELVDDLLVFNLSSPSNILWTFFCIVIWSSIIYYIYKSLKANQKEFLGFYICVILVTFFNPWVISFVTKYITGLVYFRIYDLFFNLATIFTIFFMIVEKNNKSTDVIIIISMFILFNFHTQKITILDYLNFNNSNFNRLYHVESNVEIEILKKLKNEYWVYDDEPINIAQQIYSPHVLTNENVYFHVANFYDFNVDNTDETEFQRIFYKNMPGATEVKGDYIRACELSKDREIDYFIIDAQFNRDLENGIGYCGELLFEYENYRVFKAHYDWLEWSMK
ncbi:MAG: hypothetical protein RR734_04915 [Bacilli bacterium]|uniref:hypothetical protein n=1 Tax=Anaerorhabdus sp. TaxID=1872524 RepID=UPI002FC78DF8